MTLAVPVQYPVVGRELSAGEVLSRRRALRIGGTFALGLLSGCERTDRGATADAAPPPSEPARLRARPVQQLVDPEPAGVQPLDLAEGRDGLVYVPAGYRPDRPAPMVLALHGSGDDAADALALFSPLADAAGLVVVAPASRRHTWDLALDGFGPDVAFIDAALAQTFGELAIDPRLVAIAGFSDGGSYALSLGLTNGDLFHQVIAFSPGVLAPTSRHGHPRIFVSHGTEDEVLPIDETSNRFVPRLRHAHYRVRYEQFDGPHVVPPEMVREAVSWLLPAGG
jgi:phospholipase/carboxylesterase